MWNIISYILFFVDGETQLVCYERGLNRQRS